MADSPLPNVPYRQAMLDENGLLTQSWSAFFRSLYVRVGQAVAFNNVELAALAGGSTLQPEIDALTAVVAANKAAAELSISNILQGPAL